MKHLIIKMTFASAILGMSLSPVSIADEAVSITGDGTTDVMTLQSTTTNASSSAITGDANITGFYFTQKNSNIRSGAGTGFNVLITLPKGSEVYVNGKRGQWYHIGFGDSAEGYVYANLIDKKMPQ